MAETKIRRLEAELENAREESDAAGRGRVRDRAQLERSVDALTVELTNARQDAIREVSSLREVLAQAESARRACELELETNACALREQTARADQAASELAERNRELAAGRAQLAETRAQLERESANAKAAASTVREQEAHRSRALSQRHAMAAEALKAESTRLAAACATLRDELAEATRKCGVEAEERARLQASNAAHVRSESKLAQECEELRERLRIEVSAGERWGHLLQDAQAAQFDAVSQLEAARRQATEAKVDLQAEASDARRAVANVGRDLATERARVESLGEESQRLRDAMSQLRLAEADWHAQRDTLLRDQSALRDDLAASEQAAATVSGAFARSREESARELARAKAAAVAKVDEAVAAVEQKTSNATAEIAVKIRRECEARLRTQRAELEQEAEHRAAVAAEQEAERCRAAAQADIAAAVQTQQEEAARVVGEWEARVRALDAERQCREAAQADLAAAVKAQMDEAARAAEATTRAREALDKCAQLEEALENARCSLGTAVADRAVAVAKSEIAASVMLESSAKTMADVATATDGEAVVYDVQALRGERDALVNELTASRAESAALLESLSAELEEARDQVCVCTPCKCLDGCDPGRNFSLNLTPRAEVTSDRVLEVASFGTQTDDAAGGNSRGVAELRVELSTWQRRANERAAIIEAQSAWRRRHLEREVESVREVDRARKAAKKWKSVAKQLEKAASTCVSDSTKPVAMAAQVAVAATQTKPATLEMHAQTDAAAIESARPRDRSCAWTQTRPPAPAGGTNEATVLKHALRKLQAELSEARIAFDVRSPLASSSPRRRRRSAAAKHQASSPRVVLGEIKF